MPDDIEVSRIPAWFRILLVAILILGGLHGAGLTASILIQPESLSFGNAVVWACMLLAYLVAAAVGFLYWRRPNEVRAVMWTLAVQVPWISIPGLVYKFSVSGYLVLAFVANHKAEKYLAGFNANFNLGSFCEIRLLQNAPIELGVNIVPLVALVFLQRLGRLECERQPVTAA